MQVCKAFKKYIYFDYAILGSIQKDPIWFLWTFCSTTLNVNEMAVDKAYKIVCQQHVTKSLLTALLKTFQFHPCFFFSTMSFLFLFISRI